MPSNSNSPRPADRGSTLDPMWRYQAVAPMVWICLEIHVVFWKQTFFGICSLFCGNCSCFLLSFFSIFHDLSAIFRSFWLNFLICSMFFSSCFGDVFKFLAYFFIFSALIDGLFAHRFTNSSLAPTIATQERLHDHGGIRLHNSISKAAKWQLWVVNFGSSWKRLRELFTQVLRVSTCFMLRIPSESCA